MNELLLSLIDHMRWADAIVAESLRQNTPPDPEAARLFAHIASVEHSGSRASTGERRRTPFGPKT